MTATSESSDNQSFSFAAKATMAVLAMITLGIVCRLELTGVPNVKPIAAMALWAAFAFRSVWLPAVALLIVMVVSDLVLGFYALPIAISVYASLLVSCGLGVWVRRRCDRSQSVSATAAGPRLIVASLAMSTCFYVLTNAAVWATGWYPPSVAGLVECYVAAIPFYRFTLIGDLAFTISGLVAWQLMASTALRFNSRTAVA